MLGQEHIGFITVGWHIKFVVHDYSVTRSRRGLLLKQSLCNDFIGADSPANTLHLLPLKLLSTTWLGVISQTRHEYFMVLIRLAVPCHYTDWSRTNIILRFFFGTKSCLDTRNNQMAGHKVHFGGELPTTSITVVMICVSMPSG